MAVKVTGVERISVSSAVSEFSPMDESGGCLPFPVTTQAIEGDTGPWDCDKVAMVTRMPLMDGIAAVPLTSYSVAQAWS